MEEKLRSHIDDRNERNNDMLQRPMEHGSMTSHALRETLFQNKGESKGAEHKITKGKVQEKTELSPKWEEKFFRHTTEVNEVDGNMYVIRLERNNKTLLRLRKELDSYLYEPRTCALFDRISYLRRHIEVVRTKHDEIIGFLSHHRQSVGDYLDFIQYVFRSFHDLKLRIESYMCDAHCGRPDSQEHVSMGNRTS